MWIIFGWVEWEGGEIGRLVRLGGVMDFGVGVWMNQLCEISKNSDNLLILTTPSEHSDNEQITTSFYPEKQVFYRA